VIFRDTHSTMPPLSAARSVARLATVRLVVATALMTMAGLLAAPVPASAQNRPPEPVPGDSLSLSMEAALARALGQSQEVQLARSQIELANAQVTAARAAALPQLNGNINYTRTFASPFNTGGSTFTLPDSLTFSPDSTASLAERIRYLERRAPSAGVGGIGSLFGNLPFGQANSYVASVSGSQPVYAAGRVGIALRIADRYREAARFGLAEQTADIELQTRAAYLRALLAQELERIAIAAVAQAEAFLAQERLRFESGVASELAVLRAEVSLENLRPQLVQARNQVSLATLDLKRLIDIPLRRPLRLTTPLTAPSAEEIATARVASELLLSQRASVQSAERQVAIRQEQVKLARSNYLPSIDLRFNYGRQIFPSQLFDFNGQDWRTDFTATVGVSVPIFSGFRTRAEVQQAQITLDQERLRLVQLREHVQLQYEQALGEKQRAAADLAARARAVGQAQRVYDLTVLRYEQGLSTPLEVSEARLSLLQSRTNQAQAISDFYLADANVRRAIGSSSAPAGGTMPRNP
jgi:outer membrane protein TolC